MIPPPPEPPSVRTPAVSKYEGVIPQRDYRWGAQIFFDHQCISVGTFSTEIAAARAHDSASLKFYGENFNRNFLLTKLTIHERHFQDHFSREVILDMIRNGSYEPKFIEFVRMFYPEFDDSGSVALPDASDSFNGVFVKEMFRVVLTSSDVERPGILTLPAEQAVQYFPPLTSETQHEFLQFYDRWQRLWVFQYCYSGSAGSYVLAGGWDSFLIDMQLEVNDVVVFYRCKEWRNFPPLSTDVIDAVRGVTSRCDVQEDIHVEESTSRV
ncbi:AP2/ERF and B3 domain-containing transcription factor At1g51120-like [Phalaenopsis equestris]|uniref:AP2/ERF and B3 domain-containing transcription factor At1g51120-like n=1 Tax=Phalaenopsis equestris TaxID=78828 RepID=UPI0009E59719|nr:AP2/ERF and B3 domain-containing transcription factor At1g51120-like [Phalaenopsis equestris]